VASEHTPGPWRWVDDSLIGYDGRDIFSGDPVNPEYPSQELANAHLIAAAPEMLAALEHLIEAFHGNRTIPIRPNWDMARAAIAKAKGLNYGTP